MFRYYTLHTRQSKQAASRGPAPCLASALGRAAASLRADRAVCRCDCIPLLDPAQRVPLRVRHTYPRHTRGEEASSSHPPFCALTTSISAHSGTHTHHTHRGAKLTLVLPSLSPPNPDCRLGYRRTQPAVGQSFPTERLGISLTRRLPTPLDRPSHHARPVLPLLSSTPPLQSKSKISRSRIRHTKRCRRSGEHRDIRDRRGLVSLQLAT